MTKNEIAPSWARCTDMTSRDWSNIKRILWMLLLWAVCFAGGSQLLKRELVAPGLLSWSIAILPTLAGLLVMGAYARWVRQADELQRIIQLRALAVGFGGTFFAIAGYKTLERAGAPLADAGDFTAVMAILYSVGVVYGWGRYR